MSNVNETSHKSGSGNAAPAVNTASLRIGATFQTADIEVDADKGTISNVAIMTIGQAMGHGFDIDLTTIEQISSLINEVPDGAGVECRYTHPTVDADGCMQEALGTKVGRVKNARVIGNAVRGDIYLGDYAKILPGLGDVRSYLLALAKEDPALVGMSAVIYYDVDPVMDSMGNVISRPARVSQVAAVDFVGTPAANPNGLLSAKSKPSKQPATAPVASTTLSTKGANMDDMLKSLLVGAGLNANATDDEAQEFYDGLSDDDKAKFQAKCAAEKEDGDDGAKMSAKTVKLAKKIVQSDTDEEIVRQENLRVKNIKQLAAGIKTGEATVDAAINSAMLSAIGDGLNVSQARTKICTALSQNLKPLTSFSMSVGEDQNIASLRAAIPQAICLRAGIDMEKLEKFEQREARDKTIHGKTYLGKIHERAFQLKSMSMLDMYRSYLRNLGMQGTEEMSRGTLADLLGPRQLRAKFSKVAMLAESTSDFASITLDAINKTLRFMYLDAPRTWNKWAQRAQNPDFKNINRVVLSEAPSLVANNEGGEIKYVTLSDSKEVYALNEYKAGIKLTRRAIINDDLDAFNQIPRAQANSAARKEDDVAYAVLTGNANMADGNALFSTAHANLAASNAAISIPSLQLAATAIKKQKGLAGAARLELEPKFLLVPTSIEFSTRQLIGSEKVVASQSGATPAVIGESNPFYNRYEVIGSTRLDDVSATEWYLMSDYRDGQVNTVEVCFLTDEPEPVVRQETDFDTDDVKYAIRHTVAAKAIDYRGLYANAGA